MDRQKIIANIFESIGSISRVMVSRQHCDPLPKNTPTHAQMAMMFMIVHRGPQSVKQIAEKFNISSSAVTQLVDALVKEKLLLRREDEKDRRKIGIDLTAKGKKKLEQMKKIHFEKMKKIFESLNNNELLQYQKLQQKIVEHLHLIYEKNNKNIE